MSSHGLGYLWWLVCMLDMKDDVKTIPKENDGFGIKKYTLQIR